jgi:hypothetical protein
MFLFGAHGKEIRLGFDKTKARLTMAGARPSKVPGQYDDQVRFMSRLKGKHRDVICAWFRENCRFDDLPSLDDTLKEYRSLEEVAVLPKDGASRFWRSILREYVQPEPHPVLEGFLDGGVLPDTSPDEPASELPARPASMDADGALAAARGECDAIGPGQPFLGFILGVAGIVRADASLLEQGRDCLASHGSSADQALLPVLDELAAAKAAGSPGRRGLCTRQASKLSSMVVGDPADHAVLGFRAHVTPAGSSFIRISALLHDRTLVDLGPGDAAHLFPGTGDAIAHPKSLPGYPHDYDGFSVWRVEQGRTDMSTQFVVSKWLRPVYEIVQVPHPSTQPNQVREWLLDVYRHDPAIYPLFQMADGLLVKLATGIKDPRQVDFDVPLQGYYTIEAVEWRGRKLVVEPLPAPGFKYDCSPPATLVKRLFRNRAKVEGLAGITRAQVDQLVGLLAIEGGTDLGSTRQQDLSDLDTLLGSKAALQHAIDGVLQLPAIQQAVTEEKARSIAAMREQRDTEQGAIDKLRAQKQALEQEIQQLRKDQRQQAGELAGEVKKAFERATADASKTLADVALFKALLGQAGATKLADSDATPSGRIAPKATASPIQPSGKQLASTKDINVAIARHCVASGLGQRFVQSMLAAAASQSVVLLAGSRHRAAAAMLSSILSGGIGCRVAVTADLFGVHDLMNAPAVVAGSEVQGMRLGDFISAQQSAGYPVVVQLNGANRAPLESYLPELLSATAARGQGGALSWLGQDGEPRLVQPRAPLVFLLDFVGGKSTFPLAVPLACEIPVFDTDSTWFDSDSPDNGRAPPHTHVDAGFWDSLAGGGEALPERFAAIVGPFAAGAANHMMNACRGLDVEPGDAGMLCLAAFGMGRVNGNAALQALSTPGKPLAEDLGRYLSGASALALGRFFDLDEGTTA